MARITGPKRAVAIEDVSDATLRSLAGYNLRRASNAVQSDLVEALAPFKLRMITFSALVLVVDNPGMRQSQLADALAIERSNLVVIVDDLEARDLVTRNPTPGDRRAYALRATLAGRRLCEKALRAVIAHETRVLRRLSGDEISTLVSALQAIRRGAEKEDKVENRRLSSA